MDISGLPPLDEEMLAPIDQISYTFSMGVNNRPPQKKKRREVKPIVFDQAASWKNRIKTLPEPGHIRILESQPIDFFVTSLWNHDMTLTEWFDTIEEADRIKPPTILPTDYADRLRAVFYTNQRQRWLARVVYQRWSQRVMKRRTQCNVDLLEMAPIADADALFFTDTTHRQMYRFHRRDVFSNLMSNICLSDEMLPTPRMPTNPWTNATLTLAQTIGLCQHLAADYGRRAKCPPVLFSAFWAARFDLKRFRQENSSLLAQYAIASYFKDLHADNMPVVYDTIFNLLSGGMVNFSPTAVRRWLTQPQTPLHREWLDFVRDYTMYVNLHVQTRARWISDLVIYDEARDLYRRIGIGHNFESQNQHVNQISLSPPMIQTFTLPLDIPMDQLMLIQSALFRL